VLPSERDEPAPIMDEHSFRVLAGQATHAARLLKLLGNRNRLMIACLLLTKGDMTVGELVTELRLSQSALSQHLARMRTDGVVRFRRSAHNVYYSIAQPDAVEVIGLMKRLYCKDFR